MLQPDHGFQVGSRPFFDAFTKRFRLRAGPPGRDTTCVSTMVVPITSADRVLDQPKLGQVVIIPGVADDYTAFTVPAGKAWDWIGFWVAGNATGNYSYTVRVRGGAVQLALGAVALATADVYRIFEAPVPMGPGWMVQLNVIPWVAGGTGNTVTVLVVERDVSFGADGVVT